MANSETPRISENRYFDLREVPKRGFYGLFAKRDIKAGTRILTEPVLFPHPPAERTKTALQLHGYVVYMWFCQLTEAQKKAYMQLARSPEHVVSMFSDRHDQRLVQMLGEELALYFGSTILGIEKVNCIHEEGVYEIASRFNHSCLPNCEASTRTKEGYISVHVTADVKPDEELTISYLSREGLLEPREVRRDMLLEFRYFVCSCSFCTSTDTKQLEADRARIKRLISDLGFLMYRIESAGNRRLWDMLPEGPAGRATGGRALGPLSPSIINEQGQIHLDAAMAEVDVLLSRSGLHGRDMSLFYLVIWEVALTFAGTRSRARAGQAFKYAEEWARMCVEEAKRGGGLNDSYGRMMIAKMDEYVDRVRPRSGPDHTA